MKQKNTRMIAFAAAVMMAAGALVSCGSKDVNSGPVTSDQKSHNEVSSAAGPDSTADTTANSTVQSEPNISTTAGPDGAKAEEEYTAEAYDIQTNDAAGSPINRSMTANKGGAMALQEADAEEYSQPEENGFKLVSAEPVSTFSTDVDTASYANARRMLTKGQRVYPESVRAEEFINYFSYDYKQPEGDCPIALTTELSDCPWNENSKLLLVGVQAKDIKQETRPAMNLVLLVDVSGSMSSKDKLPLMVSSFKMLAKNLDANDRISIVTYSGEEKTVLDSATGAEYDKIAAALDSLEASGCTAGEAGINMAYALAEKNFIKGGNNRIVMATDGDLNVGVSSAEELTALVEKKREGGVFLSVLGFGTGNLKDSRLEALADNGNGNYSYIDCEREAKKVLVSELNGTLYTVAKDVKAQIEFDPSAVEAYRLVGYENRALTAEDFTDDKKDAGDMGAGHSSTALYEIVPVNGVLGSQGAGFLELQGRDEGAAENTQADKLLTVKLRYKQPDGDTSEEITAPVAAADYVQKAPANLAFASCAAEFAMFLRQSEYSSLTLDMIKFQLTDNLLTDEYRREFKDMISMAEQNYTYN
ncbi:Ca-activated chloride channel family protein [Ruminococcaceae bacterium FB2012]|nr:Ca-activated chloride channel family protein [Ruminococcaceae bacterium FB2012]